MDAMVDHGKEKTISLNGLKEYMKLKKKKIWKLKAWAMYKSLLINFLLLFSSRTLLGHMPITPVPKCAKTISAKNCTSGFLSQLFMLG